MTFWQACKAAYRDSWIVIVTFPLLSLIPVAFEIAQHVVEVRIGMYESIEAALTVENNPWRLAFAVPKVVALWLPLYWSSRMLAFRDPARARELDGVALRPFAVFLGAQVAFAVVQLYWLPRSSGWQVTTFFVSESIEALLVAWGVASALGNRTLGPRESAAIMFRRVPWTVVYLFVVGLPLLVPHYVLAGIAMKGSHGFLWPILIVDSLLVGWLAALLAAATFIAATRAADKANVQLAPGVAPATATP